MLCAGTPRTTFSKNAAKVNGGDLAASEDAIMLITGATFNGGVGEYGGSIYTWGNGTITLDGCTITGAKSTKGDGGCMYLDATSTVRLVKSHLASCQSLTSGGGIFLQNKARLVVVDTSITGCTSAQMGGAISAWGQSSIVLNKARISGNNAVEGGGLFLADNATLQLPTTSVFQANTAAYIGAGVRLFSTGFNPEDLSSRLLFKANKAFRGTNPDVSFG